MNKYDELIERAKRFTDTAIVGELINAVRELKKRPDVVYCRECEYYENEECVCPYIWMSDGAHLWTSADDFCSYGEKRSNNG